MGMQRVSNPPPPCEESMCEREVENIRLHVLILAIGWGGGHKTEKANHLFQSKISYCRVIINLLKIFNIEKSKKYCITKGQS